MTNIQQMKDEFILKGKKDLKWIDDSFNRIEEIKNYSFFRRIFYMREMNTLMNKTERVLYLVEQKRVTFALMLKLIGE